MEYLSAFLAQPLVFIKDYIVPFIVVLGVLVFVHEWGHYIVARLCGVRVIRFSIGFGREIFGWTDKNETRWKVSWIPLGGYVQMFGDVDPASAQHAEGVKEGEKVRPYTPEEKKVAFFSQSVGKRSAIVFAGPAINFIFAIILMTGLFVVKGEPFTPAVVGKVMEGYPAEQAGVEPDDKIIAINGQKISRFQDLSSIIAINLGQEMDVQVLRATDVGQWEGEPVDLKITPKVIEIEDRFGFVHTVGRIGIQSIGRGLEMREHSIGTAFAAAVTETWDITTSTLKALGQMILGTRDKKELGGIFRIGAYAGEFAREGFVALITFTAMLSINLGLINLLPIPMLDGGHLAFYAMETVKGKPVNEQVQEYALRAGLAFLLCIMIFATWNDLVQLKIIDYVMGAVS